MQSPLCGLEPLEPRLLLSASPVAGLASALPLRADASFAEDLRASSVSHQAREDLLAVSDGGDLLGSVSSGEPLAGDGFSFSGLLDVYVEPGLLTGIEAALDTYAADLAWEGYTVAVQEFSGDAASLRARLQARYQQDGLEGALLVGDLPSLTFTNDGDWYGNTASFLHDLYFMDLDGEYILNASSPDEHLDGSGDVGAEIYVSRVTPSTVTGLTGSSEVELINDYFARVHAYRSGDLAYTDRGLFWADDDWQSAGAYYLGSLYDEVLEVTDPAETTRQNYLDSLALNYETVFEMIHSSVTYHSVEGTGGGTISASTLEQADPRAGYYHLWNCSSGKFTAANNLIATYTYAGDWGLNSLGSTKTGSMTSSSAYYNYLGGGDSMGRAFAQWLDAYAQPTSLDGSEVSWVNWNYGLTMQGDPTLRPQVMGDGNARVFDHAPVSSANVLEAVEVEFYGQMDAQSFSAAEDVVSFTGPGGQDLAGQIGGFSWQGSTLTISFAPQAVPGEYTLVLGPQILSAAGRPMDQDFDGAAGESVDDRYAATVVFEAAPPQVEQLVYNDGSDARPDTFTSLSAVFSADVGASLDVDDLLVVDAATGQAVDLSAVSVTWDAQALTARWDLSAAGLSAGDYEITLLSSGLEDAGGTALDGDGDGLAGGDYLAQHRVFLAGDLDLDGDVDLSDLTLLGGHYGETGPSVTWEMGDLDGDGDVDLADLTIFGGNYGATL